jgi:hypothetical protein
MTANCGGRQKYAVPFRIVPKHADREGPFRPLRVRPHSAKGARRRPSGNVNGRVEEDRHDLLVQCAVCGSSIDAARDETVAGLDRQPVSQVFGDDEVERTLDSFDFCLCPQRPQARLSFPASNRKCLRDLVSAN